MDCSTIIVSYNTFDLTREAIRTALLSASGIEHEVIVIDNASPDASGMRLAQHFTNDDRVTVVQNDTNTGFASANNQGVALSRGRILFFLNPDTLVHDDAIGSLVRFIDSHPEAGAVGPRVLNQDGTVQSSALEFPRPGWILRHHFPIGSLLRGSDRRIDRSPERTTRADVIKGCALAMSRPAYRNVGGWDESYFMYSEEIELCHALVSAGYTNFYVPESVITHFGGASSADRFADEQVKVAESAVAFLRRHNPPWHVHLFLISGLAAFGLRVVIFWILKLRYPERKDEYERRAQAARALTRWFAAYNRQS